MQMKKFNLKSNSARNIKLTQNPYRKLIGQQTVGNIRQETGNENI